MVGQEFERRARAIAKDIDGAAQGIVVQHLTTERREAIDTLAEVDGRHGQKDATLRRELQHQRGSRKVCTRDVSAGAMSWYVIRRRVPSGRWISTSVVAVWRAPSVTSTNGRS